MSREIIGYMLRECKLSSGREVSSGKFNRLAFSFILNIFTPVSRVRVRAFMCVRVFIFLSCARAGFF